METKGTSISSTSILLRFLFLPIILQTCVALRRPLEHMRDNSETAKMVNMPYQRVKSQCEFSHEYERFDCHPEPYASMEKCHARDCCWKPASTMAKEKKASGNVTLDVPYCFYPSDYPSYQIDQLKDTEFGYTAMLSRSQPSSREGDIVNLQMDVYLESETRLHFKIYDPNNRRFEVPYLNQPVVKTKVLKSDYQIQFTHKPFGITVTRKSTNNVLFDTTMKGAPFIFADQFLQISSRVGASALYGLGEHRGPFQHNMTWTQFSFWSRDISPSLNNNLYGVHPFFLAVDKYADAYGVFLLNSNAMEVVLQPTPAITYRTIGGILDFYIFTGPSPDVVVQQYTDIVGKPYLPPYWSLGFHLCRYGYGSSNLTAQTIQNMRKTGLPYDTQWNDIDYMRAHLDWTYDTKTFAGLPKIVKDLHDHGQHYVMIVDPGISSTQPKGSYPPYDTGLAQQVFIKKYNSNDPLIGKVWPGLTAFPDFTNPQSHDYWYQSIKEFYKDFPFDGLWIDMNEPSNFVDGSIEGCPKDNPLDNPPYVPRVLGGTLYAKTICPSARQYFSTHYNLHSMYGFTEAISTNKALRRVLGKRSLIISRSSFPGLGSYSGHWTGDNFATWDDLKYSIAAVMNFQLFGIPQVGADICGFLGDTTPELCTRWMQMGSFYPFMRNHNSVDQKPQDPASFSPSVQNDMRLAMELRYLGLPYLYTLLFKSHLYGNPVLRPLFFQFPSDVTAQSIDTQFLVGDALLVSPVLQKDAVSVNAYFPPGKWYPFHGDIVLSTGEWKLLDAPMNYIPIHIRGGSMIPGQFADTTTTASRKNPFLLVVALSGHGNSEGELIWDDGETLDVSINMQYSRVSFKATHTGSEGKLISNVLLSGYKPTGGMPLTWIAIYGVPNKPQKVTVDGGALPSESVKYDKSKEVLKLTIRDVDLLQPFTVTWM